MSVPPGPFNSTILSLDYFRPIKETLRGATSAIRSSLFLGLFTFIFQGTFCARHAIYRTLLRRKKAAWLCRLLLNERLIWLSGLLTGLSLLVEQSRRRTELAMYVLPRALDSAAYLLYRNRDRRNRPLPTIPALHLALSSVGLACLLRVYVSQPELLPGLARTAIYQLIGPL